MTMTNNRGIAVVCVVLIYMNIGGFPDSLILMRDTAWYVIILDIQMSGQIEDDSPYVLYNNKMSRSRNKKGKSAQTPTFISKLVEMLENESISNTISWTSTNDSFNIKNISKFTEEVLPIYFKHRNFSSFIRQLNMYGFRKIRHPDGENVYMHQNFKEGARHLLRNISRKAREEKDDLVATYRVGGSRSEVTPRDIAEIKIKQKNLEDMCKHFMVQNQRLMEENQNLIRKMEEESREKERKLQEFLIMLLTQNNTKPLGSSEAEPMLSIANGEHEPTVGGKGNQPQTIPSQAGRSNQQKDELSRIKALLLQIYNTKKPEGREKVVPEEHAFHAQNQEMRQPEYEQSDIEGQPKDEQNDSFMSINDFLNADDYEEDINLSASH